MRGNLLGLPDCPSDGLSTIFSDPVRQLLLCCNVSQVKNSTAACLKEFQTFLSCVDQINFINYVDLPLAMIVKNELGLPTFLTKYRSALLTKRNWEVT